MCFDVLERDSDATGRGPRVSDSQLGLYSVFGPGFFTWAERSDGEGDGKEELLARSPSPGSASVISIHLML